jgi:phospholipase/lecithinase/hemolysin
LYSSGARKIVVAGLGPIGCIPALRALDDSGSCSAPASAVASAHNDAMKGALAQLEQLLPHLTIVHAQFYDFLLERLENPSKYGQQSLQLVISLSPSLSLKTMLVHNPTLTLKCRQSSTNEGY